MARIDILKRINSALNPDGTEIDFKLFDEEVAKLKSALKEKVQIHTIGDVKIELEKFKKKINFEPLFNAIDKTEENINKQIENLSNKVNEKLNEFKTLITSKETNNKGQVTKITDEITALKGQIFNLTNEKNGEIKSIKDNISELSMFSDRMDRMHRTMMKEMDGMKSDSESKGKVSDNKLNSIQGELEELAKDLRSRLASLANNRGGNANRQIFIGGADPLTRYTDINLKAGTGMTLSYANNDTTKKVDITFVSSGGSGTVRSINSTAVTSVIGSVAGTDYVVICTEGVAITLPPAAGNENLYTIKNTAASSVAVLPDGAETIDADPNIILSTQYTAVDLISDGTNWNIT
mgnify:CR=1 FL=1